MRKKQHLRLNNILYVMQLLRIIINFQNYLLKFLIITHTSTLKLTHTSHIIIIKHGWVHPYVAKLYCINHRPTDKYFIKQMLIDERNLHLKDIRALS